MNVKKITTTIILLMACALILVLAFQVKVGATVESVALLKTTGMTCSSCSAKITKALGGVAGVAVTEVDIDGGWVAVGFDPKKVAPETLALKVRGAGFGSDLYKIMTPEEFRQATGRHIGKNTVSAGCGGCCRKDDCNARK
jgi:copper chaperone CopZ